LKLTTELLSSADCTPPSLHEPHSTLCASVQLCNTKAFFQSFALSGHHHNPPKNYAGRSHFLLNLFLWKISLQEPKQIFT
jgi:hypothetical protein